MEEGWERSSPIVDIDWESLQRIVEAAFSGARLLSGERLSGGLANTNFRLETTAGAEPAVLRVYTRDPGACAREAALLATVGGLVPAPRELYRDESGTVIPQPFLVETWLPGVRLQDVLTDDALLVRLGAPLGRTAARIGAVRFETPGFFGTGLPVRVEGELPGLQGYIEDSLDSDAARAAIGVQLCDEIKAFVAANRGYLEFDGRAPLVHGDYKPSNLLVDPEQLAVSGVLDWEFAFAGPPLFDLATLLRDSDAYSPDFEAAVCAGFVEGGGALPADWKRRVRLLDVANLAGFLAQPGEATERTRDVRRLLLATLRQWPQLPA